METATRHLDDLVEYLVPGNRDGLARVSLVVGPSGSGKTRLVTALAKAISDRGAVPGGIVAPRRVRAGTTVGYDVVDLAGGGTRALASVTPPGVRVGRFYLDPESLSFAEGAITEAMRDCNVIIVDEVGPLELRGGGHARAVSALKGWSGGVVLTVRPRLVDRVTLAFGLDEPRLVRLNG